MSRIAALQFTGDAHAPIAGGVAEDQFLPVEKLNFIVGANNSGKSRLLRSLFARRELRYIPNGIDLRRLNTLVATFQDDLRQIIGIANLLDFGNLLQRARKLGDIPAFVAGANDLAPIFDLAAATENMKTDAPIQYAHGLPRVSTSELTIRLARLAREFKSFLNETLSDWPTPEFVRVYIPSLRGARMLSDSDLYLKRTFADYFADPTDSLVPSADTIFTGQTLYKTFEGMSAGDRAERDDFREYCSLLGQSLFGDFLQVIPHEKKQVLTFQIGDRPDRAIHDLGDGIQQVMVILFALFFHRHRDLLLFIEEPELSLHPGMQRSLLRVLAGDLFPRAQIFATTHSNHFLDPATTTASRTKLFALHHDDGPQETMWLVPTPAGDVRLIELLGATNSSVFLTNCTIWVEGITDRMYFRRYLAFMQSEEQDVNLVEDVHYSFFEYGGANLVHWSEEVSSDASIDASRLCGRMIVLADTDTRKEKKHQRMRQLLNDRYIELGCLEVENLLTEQVLRKVVQRYEGSDANLSKAALPPYGFLPIGRLIDRTLLVDARKSVRFRGDADGDGAARAYADTTGTVKQKVDFARWAVSFMTTRASMSPRALELTRQMRRFIIESNRGVLSSLLIS